MNGAPNLASAPGHAIRRVLLPAPPAVMDRPVPRRREDLRLFAATYAAGFVFFLTLLG
jgi:hypothetical protein